MTSVVDQFPSVEPVSKSDAQPRSWIAPIVAARSKPPVIVYDQADDTLLIFPGGRRDSVANHLGGESFVLVDPDTNELAGLQFENVMARALRMNPGLIKLIELDDVELRGATKADLQRAWRRQVPFWSRLLVRVRGVTGRIRFLLLGNSRIQIQLLVDDLVTNAR